MSATCPPLRTPTRDGDADLGFAWRPGKGGAVTIVRDGHKVTVLRGAAAGDFLAEVQGATLAAAQQLMARTTGNYKRGNERTAARHPRNGGTAR